MLPKLCFCLLSDLVHCCFESYLKMLLWKMSIISQQISLCVCVLFLAIYNFSVRHNLDRYQDTKVTNCELDIAKYLNQL